MNRLRWMCVLAASCATPCQPFPVRGRAPVPARHGGGARADATRRAPSGAPSRRAGASAGRLHLFDARPTPRDADRGGRTGGPPRIPEAELERLRHWDAGAPPPFPHAVDLAPATRLVVRYLEDDDVTRVLPEVVREFGSYAPASVDPAPGDEWAHRIENYLFSLTVLIGLDQRVARRRKGNSPAHSARPDHNVICLVEQTLLRDGPPSERLVGMAELSWQSPDPAGTAPPFVLPYFAKAWLARLSAPGGGREGPPTPVAYASNVLVWKARRGRGYARVLMAALEGIARAWGCADVRLHVDAGEFTGRIARDLYRDLGYEGVPDRGTANNQQLGYDWMGPSMASQGLYLVEGVPLLYLRKILREE